MASQGLAGCRRLGMAGLGAGPGNGSEGDKMMGLIVRLFDAIAGNASTFPDGLRPSCSGWRAT